MYELFPFAMLFISVIFFYLSAKLKGEWQNLEFLFLFLGFMFLIISVFLIGILASGEMSIIGFQVMWLLILILIVVFMFFILFTLRNTLSGMVK